MKDIAKDICIRTFKFLNSNFSYILWFVIYFSIAWIIFGANLRSFILVFLVYGVSISVALSPVGEVILQITQDCREPNTEQEKNYLLPMFEEVYEYAKEVNPKLNSGIKLYIMDAMYINAFAIGRKTVTVTRGAIESLTADELKGVIAHELGHITHGHTKALLLSFIGNIFFSIIVWVFKAMFYVVQTISNIVAHFSLVGTLFSFLTLLLRLGMDLSVFVFINLSEVILALNSRKNEIEADTFAYTVGYGKEMISTLYLFQKITVDAGMKLSEKMKASHPHTAYRIAHLEKLEDEAIA